MLTHLTSRLPERVAAALLRHVAVDAGTVAAQLSRDARRKLVHALTALELPIVQHRGWNYAEVTAGGVPLNEIDYRTMESRKIRALYLAGEVLDCDGRIGGFNFQWAWASGYLAGRAAGKSLASM
jgi:predicted Rossmann fold flavoprotein